VDESDRRYEGWRVAAAGGVGVCLSTLVFYVFAVFLKPICEEFSWSRQAVSSAYGIMAASAALMGPLLGYLFDRVGTRGIALPCLVLTGCALASLALLTSRLWHLYAVFALLGVAASGTAALAYTRAVSSWFDRRRGLALALLMCGGAVGGIVHPPAAQALIGLVGWRGAWVVLGVVVVGVGVPSVAGFVRERSACGAGASQPAAGASVREALGSRAFWILFVVVFGSTVAGHGAIVHLSGLLTDRGLPADRGALAVSALAGANLCGRLLTGWLLDRFRAVRVAFVMLLIAALGTFLLAQADSFAAGALAAVLIGFGTGGELDVTPYLLSRYFGLRSLSSLYGLTWAALGGAGAVGPILLARAYDATGSYEVVLVQFAAGMLGVAGLLLALPAYGPQAVPAGYLEARFQSRSCSPCVTPPPAPGGHPPRSFSHAKRARDSDAE
jgi:MFS family permease